MYCGAQHAYLHTWTSTVKSWTQSCTIPWILPCRCRMDAMELPGQDIPYQGHYQRTVTRGAFASANMDSTKGDSKDFHFQVEWNRWKGVRDADEVMKLICDFV